MANKIIIINGYAQSGKDTFVDKCKEIDDRVTSCSYVDCSKNVAKFLGWNGNKSEKTRKFLSDINDCLERWSDMPFRIIQKIINANDNKIIFIHARQPDVIERLKNEYNGITLLIQNDKIKKITTNHADNSVDDYGYDYIVYNNGTIQNLKHSAEVFIKNVIKKNITIDKCIRCEKCIDDDEGLYCLELNCIKDYDSFKKNKKHDVKTQIIKTRKRSKLSITHHFKKWEYPHRVI